MQGEHLLEAVAYGDAAGLPFEIRSAGYIREHYGTVRSLLKPVENPFYKGDFPAGTWSDDTRLSLAVAEGLLLADGFDLEAQSQTHQEALLETEDVIVDGKTQKRGWGESTTRAIHHLLDGMSPHESGIENGAGNGILMKMAPLVFWQAAKGVPEGERYEQDDQLTLMTHASDIARLTTRVHGDILDYLTTQPYEKEAFVDHCLERARVHERKLGQGAMLSLLLEYLTAPEVATETILAATDRRGFFAPQTLAMAYGAFVAQEGRFTDSVYEAVHLGGDTDSIASIVAAMCYLADKGEGTFPADFDCIQERERLHRVSTQLAQRAFA